MNAALVDEDFEAAAELLGRAADGASGAVRAERLAKRSAAHAKMRRFQDAKRDAVEALELDPGNAQAMFRAGTACFGMEDFRGALAYFKQSLGTQTNEALKKLTEAWVCKAEFEVDDCPEIQVVENNSSNKKSDDSKIAEAIKHASSTPRKPPSYPHSWYQSTSYVTIEIMIPGLQQEQVESRIDARHVEIDVSTSDGGSISYDWELSGEIVPASSSVKVRGDRVRKLEIRLKKVDETVHWPALEGAAAHAPVRVAADSSSSSGAQKPPSAYASGKNWDAIEKEIDQDDEPQGEEALNALFKKIYKDASDDTRRAMIKSMQTSGGTVLSTNWDEVAKKDYEKERPAPKGMQWKNWEGDKLEVGDDD